MKRMAFEGFIEGTREQVGQIVSDDLANAAEKGHLKSEYIPAGKGKRVNYRIECACGWQSLPTQRKVTLLVLFYGHAADVVNGKVKPFTLGKKRFLVPVAIHEEVVDGD